MAKAFRQQVLKPAEGRFLFHPRAIERLIEEQLGTRLLGISVPDLPYYLMPRADFLQGLESENAEALSVIEGLTLPNYVILLPTPPEQGLGEASLRRLRLDYWARAFEAEVARAWQNTREDDQDFDQYGATALRALIGEHAYNEVCEVLARDGVTLPIWEDDLICRSFVAMVVRLRYFAPGARGFFFPAIRVWDQVDDWLAASGLDLPEPRPTNRLPMLMVKSRPGAADRLPEPPLLPTALPFGDSDPDLPQALEAMAQRPGLSARDDHGQASEDTPIPRTAIEQHLLAALRRGSRLRRHPDWTRRLRTTVRSWYRRSLGRALLNLGPNASRHALRPAAQTPGTDRPGTDRWAATGRRERALVAAFEERIASAQRAEFDGRYAAALRALGTARRLARRLTRSAGSPIDCVETAIAEREAALEQHLAAQLAATWNLSPAIENELEELVTRLANADRSPPGSPPARAVLRHLEQVLPEKRGDYYRLRLTRWLARPGRHRLREMLPFQSLLKALRALETARQRLEELDWSMAELERFGKTLARLTDPVASRLDAQLTPRLDHAMREADFVPRNHRERVAAQKMRLELLDVIKRRRHLKFTDVRDVVARNILRLPDPTLDEILRGNRLKRFDRAASRALPGVYRPGELYIRGLQQLGAPLFGTAPGRAILRHLLLPFGGAVLVLKTLDLLVELVPHSGGVHLTTPVTVALAGTLVNLAVYTGLGRHLARSLWAALVGGARFLLYDGIRQLLRWAPVARLMKTGLVRGLWRNLTEPMLIGTLPLIPIIALAVFIDEVPIEPGLWLAGLAFALGTLARNTPAGRRFLDDLTTGIGLYLRRINQALFIGLIQQLLYLFKEMMRRFAQLLHRVDEALTHHVGERRVSFVLKAVLAPIWRLAEALIEFYVTVLVEPQVNPVKHFPIVTVGHKLLLPFLPAITAAFLDISESILPKIIAYPLVTLTIALLPGLFGFLVWELKENWRLYQANHEGGLVGSDTDAETEMAVGRAAVGAHGETMKGLMMRGFHSGTLPKGFDRLRKVIREEIQTQTPLAKRLRRAQRHLEEVQYAICVFFERELTFALREHCGRPDSTLGGVETGRPRIATNLVELQARIYARFPQGATDTEDPPSEPDPVSLCVRISYSYQERGIQMAVELKGPVEAIDARSWSLIQDDLCLFAVRSDADPRRSELALPPLTGHGGHASGSAKLAVLDECAKTSHAADDLGREPATGDDSQRAAPCP